MPRKGPTRKRVASPPATAVAEEEPKAKGTNHLPADAPAVCTDATDAGVTLPPAPPAAEFPAPFAPATVAAASAAAELPKEVWFKFGETEESSVRIAVGSSGSSLKNAIGHTIAVSLGIQHGPIAVSLPESLANDPNKLQRFCLEGSAEIKPRATLDSGFFEALGKQALVVTEISAAPAVAVKVRFDQTVATIEGLRLGNSTVGDLKIQAVRVLSGPNERTADYSLFFDTTQPTIIWGSAAGSADWLDKFCEGIPAASADPDAEKSPRKLKGDMTLDQDFFRIVKGNVEITLRQTAASESSVVFDSQNPVESLRRAAANQELRARLGLVLKPDVRVPIELSTSKVFRSFVGRKETLEELLHFFQARSKNHDLKDKARESYAATHGAPGTGKSRLLDEVAKLGSLSIDELQEKAPRLGTDFLECVCGWIPITVTYNDSSMPHQAVDDSLDFLHFFCLRIVVSYLFSVFDFGALLHWAKPNATGALYPERTLGSIVADFVRLHPEKPRPWIFLGFDELVFAGEHVSEILTAFGNICRSEKFGVFGLVTTLDGVLVNTISRASGTKVLWIYLSLPKLEETNKLFPGGLAKELTDSSPQIVEFVQTPTFLELAAECSSHMRTLSLLTSKAANVLRLGIDSTNVTRSVLLSPAESFNFPVYDLSRFIRAVLLGNEVNPQEKPDGINTYAYLVESGVLTNTFKGGLGPFVPQTPSICIYLWAKTNVGPKHMLAKILVNMLGDPKLGVWNWKAMESFHTCWETLRCVLDSKAVTTLSDHYKQQLRFVSASSTAFRRIQFQYDAHFPVFYEAAFSSSIAEERPTVLVGENNPGYDIEALRELAVEIHSGQPRPTIALLLEVRHSATHAKTSVGAKEIADKAENCIAQLQSQEGAEWCKKNHVQVVVLVIVAYRAVRRGALQASVRSDFTLPEGRTIKFSAAVLSNKSLEALYGPSLCNLPLFLSKQAQQAAGYTADPAADEEDS